MKGKEMVLKGLYLGSRTFEVPDKAARIVHSFLDDDGNAVIEATCPPGVRLTFPEVRQAVQVRLTARMFNGRTYFDAVQVGNGK